MLTISFFIFLSQDPQDYESVTLNRWSTPLSDFADFDQCDFLTYHINWFLFSVQSIIRKVQHNKSVRIY